MTARLFCLATALGAMAAAQNPAPAPQRTILENRVTQGRPKDEQPAPAPDRSIDSVLDSTTDLNSIRDAYVRRLAGDGCRPDVAIRVAELRARLQETGGAAQSRSATATPRTSADLEGSLLILAAGWFQPRDEKTAPRANRDAERAQLLDYVLSPKDPPRSQAAAGQQANVKAELDQLLATCRGSGR